MLSSPPPVGFGLWKVENAICAQMVRSAIEVGYRHLDSASDYGNEAQSGEGIQSALRSGLVKRDELWITSKLWNTNHHAAHVRPAVERSMKDLRVDYLDLYLIHFPICLKYVDPAVRYPAGWFHDPAAADPKMEIDLVPIQETWRAMEELVKKGLVKNIGVSNFNISLIRDLLSYASVRPSVLQVESHPYLVQPKLLKFCQQEKIAFTAFSPLGAPSYVPLGMAKDSDSVLEQPVVKKIASRLGKTPAQVVLAWGVCRGTSVIPKSSRVERLKENLSSQSIQLLEADIQAISALDRNQRFNDPGVFCEAAFNGSYPIYE
jgi:D-xylose reductase